MVCRSCGSAGGCISAIEIAGQRYRAAIHEAEFVIDGGINRNGDSAALKEHGADVVVTAFGDRG
jgi:hypothetical protein